VHAHLIAAQRIVIEGLEVVGLKLTEVSRALVVLENEVATESTSASTSCATL